MITTTLEAFEHRPDCADTARVTTFEGTRGDQLASCRSCFALAVVEVRPAGTCASCGAPTGHAGWQWCTPCNQQRRAAERATGGRVEVTDAPTHRPPLTRVCPRCQTRPARDPRPGSQRGECIPCWTTPTRRTNTEMEF